MPDPHDLRRRRLFLESERATLAARLRGEERRLTDAEITADARAARLAMARIKALRREELAAATRLRAADTRITTLVTEVATEPPAAAPADATTVPIDLLGAVPVDVPLLLLPVRIEIRFRGTAPNRELLVRIFPDDIHVDTHEPGLTDEEREAGQRYWKDGWKKDVDADKAAWQRLAGMFGPERAAWVARVLTPTNLKKRPAGTPVFPDVAERPSSWSRAPRTAVLPDRWILLGYEDNVRVLAVTGEPIPDPLPVGPEPESDDSKPNPSGVLLDAGMQWLIDFDEAVKVGMAVRVQLPPNAQNGLSRLVVVGVKRSLAGPESAMTLGELLDAHHYTRGLSLIAPGTPTNNTTHTESGFDSRDAGHERSFNSERRKALFSEKGDADGAIAVRALGIDAAAMHHVEHSDEDHLHAARAMNAALWPATWGYYLEQRLAGTVSDAELRGIRQHFVEHVRAGGSLPSLRIGRQPYGVLPVTSLDRWQPAQESDAGPRALETLRSIREVFRRFAGSAPRMREAATSKEDLVSVLRMRPHSREHVVRQILGPTFVSNAFAFMGSALPAEWWAAHQSIVNAPAIGGITPTTPQSLATLSPHTDPMSKAPRVALEDGKPDYLTTLADGSLRDALEFVNAPAEPRPMLYLLARHALLRAYAQAAARICQRAGALPQGGHLDPELVNIDPNAPVETVLQRMDKPVAGVTGQRTLGAFLDNRASEKDPDVRELGETRAAMRELSRMKVDDLDRLLMETLDLSTHRFDAWASSLASRRLASLRQRTPEGVRLGGYGWLENLRPADAPVSNGFIHVPSLNHAAMAAVLASGYLSNRNAEGKPSPFALDLSSDRVRRARWLLQGVRAGQTLAELIGYRIEREMHDGDLMGEVRDVGERFPASPGIDGLKLLEARRSGAADFTAILQRFEGERRNRFTSILDSADQDLDALGDLLLAEGVFHATSGNFERAGQTLGSVINGQSLPEPESMDTPRTGVVVTHRLVKFLPAGKTASGPRAQAEPRLNNWLGEMVGDVRRVRCRVTYDLADRSVDRDLALSELTLDPIDWVANKDEDLERLILERARAKRPPRVPASATVRLDRARDPKWPRDVTSWSDFLYLLATLRKMLSALRPLVGSDLGPADRRDDSSINLKDLKSRADSAVMKLKKAASRKSPDVLGPFGIFGTALGAAREAAARLSHVEKLEAAFKRDEASPARVVEHDTERIRLVFGSTFPVLPLITPGNSAELTRAFGASKSLQGGDPLAASAWLTRAAQVRPRIAKFQDAARLVSAMAEIEEEHTVAQLPFVADEAWIALPAAPGSVPTGKLALVASGTLPKFGTAFCGVIVDEWTEMIPGARETTGLVFQFDRPAARPPQACLLAVAPDVSRPWDMETLEATILETLDLAQLRLVDQELLTEFDHYLPALQFALNVTPDVVSTDFR